MDAVFAFWKSLRGREKTAIAKLLIGFVLEFTGWPWKDDE